MASISLQELINNETFLAHRLKLVENMSLLAQAIEGLEVGIAGWITYSGIPSDSIGDIGTLCLDVLTGNVYLKVDNSRWTHQMNIRGPQGVKGANGAPGIQGIQGTQGIQGLRGEQGVQGVQGLEGRNGNVWHIGVNVPSIDTGSNGDCYLNTYNGDVYRKANDTWGAVGNIKTTTPASTSGNVILNGALVPESGVGNDSDYYINTSTFDLYYKISGVWNIVGSLRGVDGATGKTGEQGVQGIQGGIGLQGEQGLTGEQGPVGETGAIGPAGTTGETGPAGKDFTYDMFTPEQLASLVGPAGEQGIQGETGETGADFTYDMFTPEQLANLVGPQGEQGIQGETGETGATGEIGPKGDAGTAEIRDKATQLPELVQSDYSLLGIDIVGTDNYGLVDTSNKDNPPCVGINLGLSVEGYYDILLFGTVENSNWTFISGKMLWVDNSNGSLTQVKPTVAGELVQCVGRALTPTKILFNPSTTWVEV